MEGATNTQGVRGISEAVRCEPLLRAHAHPRRRPGVARSGIPDYGRAVGVAQIERACAILRTGWRCRRALPRSRRRGRDSVPHAFGPSWGVLARSGSPGGAVRRRAARAAAPRAHDRPRRPTPPPSPNPTGGRSLIRKQGRGRRHPPVVPPQAILRLGKNIRRERNRFQGSVSGAFQGQASPATVVRLLPRKDASARSSGRGAQAALRSRPSRRLRRSGAAGRRRAGASRRRWSPERAPPPPGRGRKPKGGAERVVGAVVTKAREGSDGALSGSSRRRSDARLRASERRRDLGSFVLEGRIHASLLS